MKRGPIRVWFSLALAVLILAACMGWKLGSTVAWHWYRYQEQKRGGLHGAASVHLESVLSELSALQVLRLYAQASYREKQLGEKYLLSEIKGLERHSHQSDEPKEMKPVLALELGLAYTQAAMAEEQDNKELSAEHMRSAQALFHSLGWRDCSEQMLKNVTAQELNLWGTRPRLKESTK